MDSPAAKVRITLLNMIITTNLKNVIPCDLVTVGVPAISELNGLVYDYRK